MNLRYVFTILAWSICITMQAQVSSTVSRVWVADNGNGTFKNPILHADYSDPDVIRVGTDYYMTASSFNSAPGLPILHSKDMINWRLINYALQEQQPKEVYDVPQHGKGVWAPSFYYRNKELYIYYPDPDFGIYMVKTKDPAGKWSSPVLVLPGKGYIDPAVLWDDDGQAYLAIAWAGSRAGVNSLLTMFKMNTEGTKVIDAGKHVVDGHNQDRTLEGPKLMKRNGYYYILAPAGGVSTGWQLALRSKTIYGPYERKVVMDQGASSINGPHQGALVQTPGGESWFFHFQDKEAYGRVVHLQPVAWKNDWPVIGIDNDGDGKGEPVLTYRKPNVGATYPIHTPPESDEFDNDILGLQWQWHANSKLPWYALMRGTGFLRLFAYPSDSGTNMWSVPNLLTQKFPAASFTATTKMAFNPDGDNQKKAGLIVMGNDYAYLSITKDNKGFVISQTTCKQAANNTDENILEQKRLKDSVVYLRVTVTGPDARAVFTYSEDGINFSSIGGEFKVTPGKWIGAKVGLFCTAKPGSKIGGFADVDWFRITEPE